jgi:hypothetical protein
MDIDGVWEPQRTAADEEALATLYRTGRVADGSGSAHVAEIDARTNPTDVGFHPPFHSWSWRARIDRTLGNHDNNVIWVSRGGAVPSQFDAMRAWLDGVYADTSSDPLPVKIAKNKPADVKDTCYASAVQGGPRTICSATGTAAQWQYYSHMRWVAGWPMELDTFKCQLKPLDRQDYRLPAASPLRSRTRSGASCSRRSPRACATSRSPPSPTSRRFRGSRSRTDRAVVTGCTADLAGSAVVPSVTVGSDVPWSTRSDVRVRPHLHSVVALGRLLWASAPIALRRSRLVSHAAVVVGTADAESITRGRACRRSSIPEAQRAPGRMPLERVERLAADI